MGVVEIVQTKLDYYQSDVAKEIDRNYSDLKAFTLHRSNLRVLKRAALRKMREENMEVPK